MNIGKRAIRIALINALGAVLAFGLHVVLARVLGASDYGHYIFVIAVAMLLGTIALFGFDTACLRFVAEYRDRADRATLNAFTRFARARVFKAALVISAGWAVLALVLFQGTWSMLEIHLCGAVLVTCFAYSQLHASLLQGQGRADESQAIQLLARPIAIVVAIAVLIAAIHDLDTIHVLLTTAAITTLAGAWMQWKGGVWNVSAIKPRDRALEGTWADAAISMLGLAVVNQVLASGDVVLATLLLGPQDAGVYAAAVRLASLVSFATTSFNFILAPTISALYSRKDIDGLQRTVSQLTIGAILYATPILLGIAIFGRDILALFGPEFVSGYWVLVILCIGQAVLTANGAVGFLMTMTNNHRTALRVVAMSSGLLIMLSLALAPLWGLIGIAIAAGVATAFRSIMLDHWVRKLIGVRAAPIAQLPALAGAAFRSAKDFVKDNFPGPYSAIHAMYYPVLREARLISKVGIRGLVRHAVRGSSWLQSLPKQKVRALVITPGLATLDDLLDHIKSTGLPYSVGAHSVYIPPATLSKTELSLVVQALPSACGLKILKNTYTNEGIGYLHGPGHSPLQRAITYAPPRMVLVANLLHRQGLGPRIVDFVQIQSGDTEWFGYVVEHCEGTAPSTEQCEQGMDQLKQLEQEKVITVTVPGGYSHPDLTCPTCNGNAVARATDGAFQYLDFQNFVLENYQEYLTRTAKDAIAATHFGDTSIFRGGGYLYQSVPGLALAAKRVTDTRGATIAQMLRDAGTSVEGRLVLDVGCNLGMMMGEYLCQGAAWCHGWDRRHVTQHAEHLLLSIGCTRFSLTGTDLAGNYDLAQDIPDYLRPIVQRCVVSYLSVKGHVGWIDSLPRIPWTTLILEGHEGESLNSFKTDVEAFCTRASAKISVNTYARDGDSDSRHLAILSRLH